MVEGMKGTSDREALVRAFPGYLLLASAAATLKVKIFVQWPFGDQLFGFSRQGKFLAAKLY